MPFASGAGGARIHWSEAGAGEPLVLVMGLGCASALWFRLVPRLARRFRLILLDNRGVGLTEAPNAVVHRVTTLADDVAAVLDAAGEATAHVAGLSMGGMIAQEFAPRHQHVHDVALELGAIEQHMRPRLGQGPGHRGG